MQIASVTRRRRRLNLTPMIDVVLLLLVFFMMVSRFGGVQGIPVAMAGAGVGQWSGPPRLIVLGAEGVTLNGLPVAVEALAGRLAPLMTGPDDPVILRAGQGAAVQDLVTVLDRLRGAGIARVIVAE